MSFWCICPFLPKKHRPHIRSETFGTPNSPCNATSTGHAFSGLQSFRYVQAPMLARPPDCTHRCGSMTSGQPGRLRHAMNMWLPNMSCGIATCLNRAIGMAGLSPAGLQPCRLLPRSVREPLDSYGSSHPAVRWYFVIGFASYEQFLPKLVDHSLRLDELIPSLHLHYRDFITTTS